MNELMKRYAYYVTEPLRIPSVWAALKKEVIPWADRESLMDMAVAMHPMHPADNEWMSVEWAATYFIVSLWDGPHTNTQVAPVMWAQNHSYWWPILQTSHAPFPTPSAIEWLRKWTELYKGGTNDRPS